MISHKRHQHDRLIDRYFHKNFEIDVSNILLDKRKHSVFTQKFSYFDDVITQGPSI